MDTEGLLAQGVDHVLALGSEKPYVCCTLGSHDRCADLILPRLCGKGQLKVFTAGTPAAPLGEGAKSSNCQLEVSNRPLEELPQALCEPVAGVLLHLGRSPPPCAGNLPQSLQEWLHGVSVAELAAALDNFGCLHDRLLSDRLAEAVLQRQRGCGPYRTAEQLTGVLEGMRPDFADTHPGFHVAQVLRAMAAALDREAGQLDGALEGVFQRLEPWGRCVVVSFNPWELKALHRFLHSHEEPVSRVACSIQLDRLAQLYPLLSGNKDYTVRRVFKSLQAPLKGLAHEEQARSGMLHVLEKVPRSTPVATETPPVPGSCAGQASLASVRQPPLPPFGVSPVASQTVDGQSDAEGECSEPGCADVHELERLKADIAARKLQLREGGQGSAQLRKDQQIAAWTRRLNELHCTGRRYAEKVQQRCRDRCHVSVLLTEAIEQTMSLGPDEVYVDCTFGRGGHSRLMLSGLSDLGRLKAFDVDPLAVEVGRGLERSDQRFQMIHRPFGDLAAAVQGSIAGVLLDLGVSSPQLDDSSRGFSRRSKKDGPLDLRMNQGVGLPASQWLQTVTAGELAWVIASTCYRLESPLPERIAEAILQRQKEQGPYVSTAQLAGLLHEFSEELHDEQPSTSLAHLVFCAIRVFLNREQQQLDLALQAAFEKLKPGGRCVVICFTRWEMAAVRRFLRCHERPRTQLLDALAPARLAELYPLLGNTDQGFSVRQARQPVRPSAAEIARNQRAKSLMYVLEKCAL